MRSMCCTSSSSAGCGADFSLSSTSRSVDRGPRVADVLRDVIAMHADGVALAVPGNAVATFFESLPSHLVLPVAVPEWYNRTINIDTGRVFGGRLTALRWPERELVSVPARGEYALPARPFGAPRYADPPRPLDVSDASGNVSTAS